MRKLFQLSTKNVNKQSNLRLIKKAERPTLKLLWSIRISRKLQSAQDSGYWPWMSRQSLSQESDSWTKRWVWLSRWWTEICLDPWRLSSESHILWAMKKLTTCSNVSLRQSTMVSAKKGPVSLTWLASCHSTLPRGTTLTSRKWLKQKISIILSTRWQTRKLITWQSSLSRTKLWRVLAVQTVNGCPTLMKLRATGIRKCSFNLQSQLTQKSYPAKWWTTMSASSQKGPSQSHKLLYSRHLILLTARWPRPQIRSVILKLISLCSKLSCSWTTLWQLLWRWSRRTWHWSPRKWHPGILNHSSTPTCTKSIEQGTPSNSLTAGSSPNLIKSGSTWQKVSFECLDIMAIDT